MNQCQLPEILLLEPVMHADARGHFFESWNADRFSRLGITEPFVQDNVSRSVRDVVRGLHFQHPHDQAKLVTVLFGTVFDVAVDVRADSPRFGRWMGVELSDAKPRQLFLPAGFAHGVVALTAEAIISYKCTAYYAPGHETSIQWDDPDIGVEWPTTSPVLSDKDKKGIRLRDIPGDQLPVMG